MCVLQSEQHQVGRKGVDSVERAECVKASEWAGRLANHLFQCGNNGSSICVRLTQLSTAFLRRLIRDGLVHGRLLASSLGLLGHVDCGGRLTAPDQHLLGHVALPAIGRIECRDETRGVQLVEPGERPRRRIFANNAIDSPQLAASSHVQLALPRARNPLRMLDHRTIHVGNPQGAIRTCAHHNRS